MFLAFINASSYSEPTLYSFVFSGTRPSANSDSSSSLANFEAFGRNLDAGGGAVRVVYSVRDGGTAGRGELRGARRGQSVHSHILHRCRKKHLFIPVYCICGLPESYDSDMISCDRCEQWFHFRCMHIQTPPPETWFCSDCI